MGIISDCTKSKKESSLRRLFFLPLKYYKTQKWESYDLVKEECLEKITKKRDRTILFLIRPQKLDECS